MYLSARRFATVKTETMGIIIEKISAISAVKNIRVRKWCRRATFFMFSEKERAYINGDPERARDMLKKQAKKFPSHAEAIRREALAFTDDSSIAEDILLYNFLYGFSVCEYICYGFSGKTAEERSQYLSERESVLFAYAVNDIDAMNVFSDKYLTYKKFGEFYGRQMICCPPCGVETFSNLLSEKRTLVKKSPRECCGRGVERICWPESPDGINALFDRFTADGTVIFEEEITQADALGVFNPSSVNTVRCITLLYEKEAEISYAFLKTGRHGNFVDNGAAGGIMSGIDIASGCVDSFGIDESGVVYKTHPDSAVEFKGTVIPEWGELCDMCKKLASEIPSVRFIGWDAAYTENGWVVIEGNAMSEVIGIQGTLGRGIRREMTEYASRVGCDMKKYAR